MSALEQQLKDQVTSDPFFGESVQFVLSKIDCVENKTILDSGCGSGKMCSLLALLGGKIIGIDKSIAGVRASAELAQSVYKQRRCLFIHGNSERIPVADQSVDIIFSKSTIQYMERSKALDEYYRIVKPRGIVLLLENKPHNPFVRIFRLYRKIFKRGPRDVEYVKSISGYIDQTEIDSFSTRFKYTERREYHLTRMLSIYLRVLFGDNTLFKKFDLLLQKLDHGLLRRVPFLRRFAWFVALYCQEKAPLHQNL